MAGAFACTGGAAGPVDQMSRAESNAEAPVGTGLVMLCGAFFDSAAHTRLMAHFRFVDAITLRLSEHDTRQTASPATLAFANRICRAFHIHCIEGATVSKVPRATPRGASCPRRPRNLS